MATEKLEIQVSADVKNAVAGMDRLNKSLDQAAKATPKLTKGVDQAGNAVTNLTRIVSDAPFSVLSGNLIAVSNNIDPLIQSFRSLNTAAGGGKAAFQALISSLSGGAGLALAVSAVTAAFTLYSAKQSQAASEARKAKEELQDYSTVQKEVSESVAKEVTRVQVLVGLLKEEGISRQNKVNALKELKTISPEYFNGLKIEDGLVRGLSDAYAEYVKNIGLTIEAKTIEKQLEQINAKLLEGKTISAQTKVLNNELVKTFQEMAKQGGNAALSQKLINQTLKDNTKLTGEDFNLNFQKNALFNRLLEIYKLIRVEQKGGIKETKEATESVKEYKAAVDGILSGYLANNAALKEQATLQELLNDLQRKSNELRKGGEKPPSLLTPEQQLNLAGDDSQVGAAIENIETIKKKFIEVNDVINNGINAGIDQFFNAIANNQDPFEALAQSVKRLVAELAAAVVKALILKAVTAALSGGTSSGLGALTGLLGGGGGVLRGDQIRSLTFLRG